MTEFVLTPEHNQLLRDVLSDYYAWNAHDVLRMLDLLSHALDAIEVSVAIGEVSAGTRVPLAMTRDQVLALHALTVAADTLLASKARAEAAMGFQATPNRRHWRCHHVRKSSQPGIMTADLKAIPGRTRSDLHERNELCVICSGELIAFLQRLQA